MSQAPTLQDMTRQLHELYRLADSDRLKAGPRALLFCLLMPWNRKERRLWFGVDIEEMGLMIGKSRSTAYRHMNELERLGLIAWRRGERDHARAIISLQPLYDQLPEWLLGNGEVSDLAEPVPPVGHQMGHQMKPIPNQSQTSPISSPTSGTIPKAQSPKVKERGADLSVQKENRRGEETPFISPTGGPDAGQADDHGPQAEAGRSNGQPMSARAMYQVVAAAYPGWRVDSEAEAVWLDLHQKGELVPVAEMLAALEVWEVRKWGVPGQSQYTPKLSNWLGRQEYRAEKWPPVPKVAEAKNPRPASPDGGGANLGPGVDASTLMHGLR